MVLDVCTFKSRDIHLFSDKLNNTIDMESNVLQVLKNGVQNL